MADTDTATTLARVAVASAGLADPLTAAAVVAALQGVALAIITPPDPHEVVSVDPTTGEVTPPPPPVADDGTPLVPRDETQDSIDPATGTLTPEAVARRAQLKADQDKLDSDKAADEALHGVIAADEQAVADDEAAIAAETVADPAA